MRSIIIPGEALPEGSKLQNSYLSNGRYISEVVVLYDQPGRFAIPLEGIWQPKVDEDVIGIIKEAKNHVYTVDLSYFGEGLIIDKGYERHSFAEGEAIEAKVKAIEDKKTIVLGYPKVLIGGIIVRIKPTKIARVIGKSNTMINMIAEYTKTRIVIGNNGLIWLKGENIALAMEAIRKIEEEAHTSGLTDRIKNLMEEKTKGV
ncbi:MAG: KH domain-containing protein [Candidatus Micrarchaeaceae archaeon]